jgi:hypothetical protein
MLPYPTGYLRDSKSCNIDRDDLVTASGALRDLRASSGKNPGCVSPFGVRNLTGNVEEFVVAEDGSASRKGAYWQPAANSCRARRPHTDLEYAGVETGLRCCAAAQGH